MKAFLVLCLVWFVSCGKDSGGGGGGKAGPQAQNETIVPQENEGTYRAILRPLNYTANGFLPSGKAQFTVSEDLFSVKTYLDDDQRVVHMQSVHAGSRCPDERDDKNNDGFVDYFEAIDASGKILMPLDGDLSSHLKGQNSYPVGKSFTYTKTISLNDVLQGLTEKESIPSYMTKLNGTNLNLGGRVVMIHGTAPNGKIPSSVRSLDGVPSHLSLPVACGVVRRI